MKKENKFSWIKVMLYVCALMIIVSACDDDDDEDNIQPASITPPPSNNNSALSFNEPMTGLNEVPQVITSGNGSFVGTFDPTTKMISYTVTWTLGNANDQVTGMHFHGPADTTQSAPIVIGVTGFPTTSTGAYSAVSPALTAQQEADLRAGKMYFNVHSTTYPTGELRGNLK